jgi:Helix-turn-helix domain
MSVEAFSWALRVPIGGNQKVVLLGLANHAHPDGTEAYPSLDTLAIYAACDRSTARRNVRKLVEAGWVIEDGVGPRGENKYRLPLGGVAEHHPVASAPEGGGISDRGGVAPMPPEPSKEPSKEPHASLERAGAKATLPEDFPDDLREHLRFVYRILRDAATTIPRATEINPRSLALVVMARPRHPLIRSAHDYTSWLAQNPRHKDLVAGYRNWVDKAQPLAKREPLPGEDEYVSARTNGSRPLDPHVADMLRRAGIDA